jgi:hypothetical protein
VIWFSLLVVAAGVGIARNWKIAEHPPCVSFLDGATLAALAKEPLGEPEVTVSNPSCVADWGSVRVHMHCLATDEPQWDRRAESWSKEPGFVSTRELDLGGTPARIGVMEQVRFGGHARSVRLLVPRPLGWLEVAVSHHWPDSAQAPALTGDVESALTASVTARLPASRGCLPTKSDE